MKTVFSIKLHPCKYCTNFDEEIEIYEDLCKTCEEEKDPILKAELNKRLELWSRKIEALRRHKDKHEQQRAAVQKWKAQCHLFPGVVLVYEDFCNLYKANMAKMLNLVMVLVYWDGKEVKEDYHDTFCRGSFTEEDMANLEARGSQDNHVYRECWLKAFEKGVFADFHTIIKTGDNGSALKSYDTMSLHCELMREHAIRIIYHTLCPGHAENPCDPAGYRTKEALGEFERKFGTHTGDAQQTAKARDLSRKQPNVKPARFAEAVQEFNRYMPEELIRKKQDQWPYSVGQCCLFFFQLTDIHENAKHPVRTIELGPCGMCAPTATDKFGVIDLRWENLDKKKVCMRCSTRFRRTVPKKEHNQKGFFLCPQTNVYRHEDSLDRICKLCKRSVRDAHKESPHQTDKCPSKEKKGVQLHSHESFRVITIDGPKQYPITWQAKKWDPSDFTPADLEAIRSRYRKGKTTEEKHINPKAGSLDAAEMMAAGITAVYKIESISQIDEKGKLSWGIGVCKEVKIREKVFEIQVFAPTNPDAVRAPWGTWTETTTKKEISFASTWLKVNKLTGKKNGPKKIPTKVLHQIWKDKRFAWRWISVLDTEEDLRPDDDLVFEPQPVWGFDEA